MSVMAGSVIFKPTAKASSTSANKTERILLLHRPDGATWPLSNSPKSTRMFLELRIPNYIRGLGKSGDLGHGCIGTITIHKEYGAFIYSKISFLWLMKVSVHKSQ